MRELTFIEPGSVEWRDVAEPALDGPAQALVRPLAVATCDLDAAIVNGASPFQGPLALGHEFVAEVVEVGEGVEEWSVGDVAVVPFQISCGACEACQRGWTGNCREVRPRGSMYGIGPAGGEWGGALADRVRVPFADAMLLRPPDGVSPAAIASASDNVSDAYRTVAGPLAAEPGAEVLIVAGGAASISLYAVDIAQYELWSVVAIGLEQTEIRLFGTGTFFRRRMLDELHTVNAAARRVDRYRLTRATI